MVRQIKYLVDGMYKGSYVRAWSEDRSNYAVQIWKDAVYADGEPDGDWSMPKALWLEGAVTQAMLQTQKRKNK